MDKDGVIPNKRFFLDALGAIGSSKEKLGSANAGTGSNSPQKFAKTQLET
jgi:hypothetical protein